MARDNLGAGVKDEGAAQKAKAKPRGSAMKSVLKKVITALIVAGIYFGWALLFYHLHEGWRPLDAIYFAMVTMSTVGYGDFSPRDDPIAMWNTVAFIFFGILVVFAEVSSCVAMLMAPLFKAVRNKTELCFPQKSIDLDGDGSSDFKIPRGPLLYYSKKCAPLRKAHSLARLAFPALSIRR